MKKLLIALALMLPVGPLQAAYISDVLEADNPAVAFKALFEGEGYLVLSRDAAFGETERRVESCAEVMQARAEGFETLSQNETVHLDDWAWARCEALAQLRHVTEVQMVKPTSLTSALAEKLPAFVGEARTCEDQVAAVKASIRGENWLPFAQNRKSLATPIRIQDQPSAQFDLLVQARQPSNTLAVAQQSDDMLGLYFNTAAGTFERLAELDLDGDGQDDLLVHLTWDDETVGTYRSSVLRLKKDTENTTYALMDLAYWLGETIKNCPDHLADVLIGPPSLRK